MHCIVPLAGPDFYHPSYGIKPMIDYRGRPLIEALLKERSWYDTIEQFIFVLQDSTESRNFQQYAKGVFPHSSFVYLTSYTKGALLSSLAGAGQVDDFHAPIIVDLVDIDYTSQGFSPQAYFEQQNVAGIIPYFTADDPCYSYLEVDKQGFLIHAKEKEVISDKASCGTYFFKNLACFLTAVEGSIQRDQELAVNGLFYLCPSFNVLIERGEVVMTQHLSLVSSISKETHVYGH
ncbi:hypothetical protein JYU14_02410 [Simkania negevensis]|uniref:Uncharacterized protein n=1 Tax=Simkania negevensis TaxID=83561 RepID=A0ABS3ARD8_9BACT|nr:hypothetical protein [Simkania negevensis]